MNNIKYYWNKISIIELYNKIHIRFLKIVWLLMRLKSIFPKNLYEY